MIRAKRRQPSKQTSTRDRRRPDHVACVAVGPVMAVVEQVASDDLRAMQSDNRMGAQLLLSDGLPNGAALLLGVYFRHGLTAAQFGVVFR